MAIPKSFIDQDSKSNYTRLTAGKHRLRILGDAITGWLWWTDTADGGRKPNRVLENETVPVSTGEQAAKFLAFPVFNYTTGNIQILEVTQKTLKRPLLALEADPDWGDLKEYDIEIERTGTDKNNTKYFINPKPKQPLKEELQESILKNGLPEIRALYFSEDPFTFVLSKEQEKELEERAKIKGSEEAEKDDLPF